MGGFRSNSCRERWKQMEIYSGGAGTQSVPSGMQDLRSHSISCGSSTSYTAGPHLQPPYMGTHEFKIRKGKRSGGGGTPYLKALSFNDPELQRKKRVAGYKVYSVEGKVKGSIRKSFKWIKDTYTQVVYGWW